MGSGAPGPGDDVLPVGAIFLSVDDTDPGDTLGYGTWLLFGAGRMLIGVDPLDPTGDTPLETSGADACSGSVQQATFTGAPLGNHTHAFSGSALGNHTHTFTGDALGNHLHTVGTIAPSAHAGAAVAAHSNHTHGVGTLDNAAISAGTPAGTVSSHAHELPFQLSSTTATRQIAAATFGTGTSRAATGASAAGSANTTSAAVALSQAVAPTFTGSALGTHDHTISGSTGNESASLTHSVTQPSDHTMSGSTANASAGTPSGTNSNASAGTPAGVNTSESAGTPSGTINAQSFTGAAGSNRPPAIAVYMFRRTA